MAGQAGFFDGAERLKALSAAGDPLERLARVIDFEVFLSDLKRAPLSDDQTEYQLKDRLSFMRFVGLALHAPVPDAKTIWLFRVEPGILLKSFWLGNQSAV